MAHQVFVSYATEDADTATRVCALLEADGIVCWMAPRDVEAGTDYAAAIMDAIRNSQLVVLIFSTFSNASPYALREIERAVAYQRPVLALRTDDTVPNSSIEYYVNVWQKLKAAAEVEKTQEQIVAAVRDTIRASKAAGQQQTGVPRKGCQDASLGAPKVVDHRRGRHRARRRGSGWRDLGGHTYRWPQGVSGPDGAQHVDRNPPRRVAQCAYCSGDGVRPGHPEDDHVRRRAGF